MQMPARRILIRVLPAVVVLAALLIFLRARSRSDATAATRSDATASAAAAPRPVPVIALPVEQRDVPMWLEGLGSVAAVQQVTVRTQVDGRLDRVHFTEGKPVRKGD